MLNLILTALATLYAGPIRGPAEPPPGATVTVREYTLPGGAKLGVREWTETVPSPAADTTMRGAARPRPERPSPQPPPISATPTPAASAPVQVVPTSDADLMEIVRTLPVRYRQPDGRVLLGTVGSYLDAGGDPRSFKDSAGTMTPAELALVHALPRKTVVHPQATTLPARSVPPVNPTQRGAASPATRTISVTGAAPASTRYYGSTRTAPTRTVVLGAATAGGTNCANG